MSLQNDPKAMRSLSAIKLALTTRKIRLEVAEVEHLASEPIAIVGMACRFPGGATSPERFWDMLNRGVDAIREVPPDRWDVDAYFDADPAAPGKIGTRWGGFLDRIDQFDAEFFGIAPREANRMDPQQRLLLEVTWEALDNAGYPSTRLAGSLTGVYLASYNSDYAHMLYNDIAAIDAHTSSGTAHSISSGRIAFLLDLKGPCLTVDTACSSSLVAVHLAVQALRQRECRTALAGGVSLILSPEQTISLSKWGMLAPDGRCKTFDAGANGFIRGEGCGIVVLKRLSDALEDDDRILAVLRGSAVNHDGRSNALTAPNGLSQEAVIRQAMQNACIDPSSVSYIEAHGTGTALGDPIEVEALNNIFGGPRPDGDRCLLGSVKTNIGHLEAAAGMAGLIKVVLSLRHEKIPPHLHFKKLNPMISFAQSCLSIKPEGCQWPAGAERRYAGVSSFGFGGTNAHVVIEEAPRLPAPSSKPRKPHLLPISARTADGLQRAAQRFQFFLSDGPGRQYNLEDICHTAAVLRTHYDYRLALSASSHDQMVDKLSRYINTGSKPVSIRRRRPRIGFVFSGQGAQWPGMGRDLLKHDALFGERIGQCDEWLRRHAGWSPIEVLSDEDRWPQLQRTEFLQPILFALQVALAARLKAWGLHPEAVVGHSVGELAAACVGGVLSLEQALKVVVNRARLMQQAAGQGMMASVEIEAEHAQEMIRRYGDRISIAAVNAPRAVTFSGETEVLSALLKQFKNEGRFHRVLPVDCAFHSAHMTPFQKELTKEIGSLAPQAGRVPFYSTVTGGFTKGQFLDAAYWGRNLREPVAFASAIQAMTAKGFEIFVEIGPHPVLLPFVDQILEAIGKKAVLVPTLRRNQPGQEVLLDAAAGLYTHGCEVDWGALSVEKARCVSLPTYPWQRERFWAKSTPKAVAAAPTVKGKKAHQHPLLGERLHSPLVDGIVYRSLVGPGVQHFLSDHRLLGRCVVPGTAMFEMALASALTGFRTGELTAAAGANAMPLAITNASIHDALILEDNDTRELHFGLDAQGNSDAAYRLFSSESGTDQWTLHAQGTVHCGVNKDVGGDAWPRSLDVIRSECAVNVDVNRHYADFRKRGLTFGPAFKGITALWRNEDSALALIEPPGPAFDSDGHVIHPAYLDAWLQVLGVLLPIPDADSSDGHLFLPVALERLEVNKIPRGRVWSCGHFVQGSVQAGQLDGEVAVFDDNGDRIAQISGLRLMATPSEKLMPVHRQSEANFMFEIAWQDKPLETPANAKDDRDAIWVVFGCDSAAGRELAKKITEKGLRCVQVSAGETFESHNESSYRIDPRQLEDFQRLFDSNAVSEAVELKLVHLFGLKPGSAGPQDDVPASEVQHLACGSALHMVQALASSERQRRARIWLVTRGSRHVVEDATDVLDAFQAPLWGLGGVIAQEHPELDCIRIDLDALSSDAESAMLLSREIASGQNTEAEIAFRRGTRFVPRLALVQSASPAPAANDTERAPIVLMAQENGIIDKLAFVPAERRPPGCNEIEIATDVVGLNFRDVLNALKMLPGAEMPLGGECAGRVVVVGEDVKDLKVGDEVLAFGLDAFRSFVTVNRDYVTSKPASMSFEAAASIPVVFLTAQYALRHLSNIAAEDKILIHAAAGGVGLAAVQIAQMAGAEIFATAGNTEKRDYLRSLGIRHIMDSRSVDFADEVMEKTQGRGVDYVLNSLSGEMIAKSLSIVCPGGTFFEIGKRDIWEESEVSRFRPGITYRVFDMATIASEKPSIIRGLLDELMKQFIAGALAPLNRTVFSKEKVADAFHTMARAKHIGKIVVRISEHETNVGELSDQGPNKIGTYLITGGLGALGLETARWLVKKGAHYIALAGRRPPNAEASAKLAAMQKKDVQVAVFQADVADQEGTERLLDQIAKSMPPLCGIVHAAGVLDDGALLTLDWQRFRNVLAPKIDGAWNLHRLTRRLGLEFFICFSSVASIIGWPGQGSYAAANAFLDGLAHQRRREGLSGLSINWGPWSEGGMAANLTRDHRRHFTAMGLGSISSAQGMRNLERILSANGQIIVMPMDWERFRRNWPDSINRALFEAFTGPPTREDPRKKVAVSSGTLREILEQAQPGNRMTLLMEHLERQAANILGLASGRRIEPLRPLKEIGLDSLMAVELRNALNVLLAYPLPATLLFDYPSLQDLARYLAKRVLGLKTDEAAEDQITTPEHGLQQVSDLTEISDQEAEEMLLSELKRLEEKQNG